MKKIHVSAISLALALAAAPASAQEAASPAASSPATGVTNPPAITAPPLLGADSAYFEEEAALTRRLRLSEMRAKIAENESKAAGKSGAAAPVMPVSGDSVNMPPVPISRSPQPTSNAPVQAPRRPSTDAGQGAGNLPFRLVSIWGVEGSFRAEVVSRGLRVTVGTGDSLPDGWKVNQIARTGIQISRGRERRTLTVGG